MPYSFNPFTSNMDYYEFPTTMSGGAIATQTTPMTFHSGCRLWLHSNKGLTIQEPIIDSYGTWLLPTNRVTRWEDQSGTGNHFVWQTDKPRKYARGIVPGVEAGGHTGVVLYTSPPTYSWIMQAEGTPDSLTDFTAFVVVRHRGGYNGVIEYWLGNLDGLCFGGTQPYYILAYDGAKYIEGNAQVNIGEGNAGMNILCYQNNHLWKNGAELGYNHVDVCESLVMKYLGHDGGPWSTGICDFFEIIVYNSEFDSTEVGNMFTILNGVYGVY